MTEDLSMVESRLAKIEAELKSIKVGMPSRPIAKTATWFWIAGWLFTQGIGAHMLVADGAKFLVRVATYASNYILWPVLLGEFLSKHLH